MAEQINRLHVDEALAVVSDRFGCPPPRVADAIARADQIEADLGSLLDAVKVLADELAALRASLVGRRAMT